MSMQRGRPAIARIWRGRTRRDRADEYEAYNYEAGVKPLIEKAMGVQALRQDRDNETEFMTISYWESIEAMSRFTGGGVSHRTAEECADSPHLSLARRLEVTGRSAWAYRSCAP
jgi:heme-degrading monooxygenase HmoA